MSNKPGSRRITLPEIRVIQGLIEDALVDPKLGDKTCIVQFKPGEDDHSVTARYLKTCGASQDIDYGYIRRVRVNTYGVLMHHKAKAEKPAAPLAAQPTELAGIRDAIQGLRGEISNLAAQLDGMRDTLDHTCVRVGDLHRTWTDTPAAYNLLP